MPLRSNWTGEECPIARSLEVLGDPWALLVLRQAFMGVRRFDQLRDQLRIADNVLSKRLAGLVEAGLLRKQPYRDERRTRDEYVLTEAGEDTFPIITALALWGDKHRPHPDPTVHMDVIHRRCGHATLTADHCSHCGQRLTVDGTFWRHAGRQPRDLVLAGR
ncbi:MAG TPA: helix-turn-helix domain-containing protein [Microlunatus sp.]|nr:helix-turn-helix domain-containing protein [Microlunatus sp.]